MPKHMGINRAYVAGEITKTPQEKQRELDEMMKKFLEKGGKVEQCKPHKPTKEQLKSWKV
jgi:D-ribose pyranose/furanose isomerase RbsD